LSEEIKLPIIQDHDYSVKITGHKDYVTVETNYKHKLSSDVTFDIANQMSADAYRDIIKRLEKDGFTVLADVNKR